MFRFSKFTENVKKWLVDAGQPYVQSDVKGSEHDVLSVADSQEIGLRTVSLMFHILRQAM